MREFSPFPDDKAANFVASFAKMRYDLEFSDVTLNCDGVKIRAHVAVLAARSAYFKDIFRMKDFVAGTVKTSSLCLEETLALFKGAFSAVLMFSAFYHSSLNIRQLRYNQRY